MRRMSVYAYESNEVYFARLRVRLCAYANVRIKKKKYTLALRNVHTQREPGMCPSLTSRQADGAAVLITRFSIFFKAVVFRALG